MQNEKIKWWACILLAVVFNSEYLAEKWTLIHRPALQRKHA